VAVHHRHCSPGGKPWPPLPRHASKSAESSSRSSSSTFRLSLCPLLRSPATAAAAGHCRRPRELHRQHLGSARHLPPTPLPSCSRVLAIGKTGKGREPLSFFSPRGPPWPSSPELVPTPATALLPPFSPHCRDSTAPHHRETGAPLPGPCHGREW
jgi:hypothetical protein